MSAKKPLVSFLTITRDRPELLRRCVDQFFKQTYSEKELVIVVDPRSKFDDWLPEFEVWLDGHPDVSVEIGKSHTVGGLRNETLKLALGKIVATWDDDDYNHPERVARQVAELERLEKDGIRASYLSNAGVYLSDSKKYSIATFDAFGLAPSMVAWKDSMTEYPELERASDSVVQRSHYGRRMLVSAPNEPWLYARVYHGKNIWEREHFERLIATNSFRRSWMEAYALETSLQIGKLFGDDEAPREVVIHGDEVMKLGGP